MVVGLLPVVGMPLPFISQGGSSLLSLFIAFGIIVSMGTHKKFLPQ
jgi:rod shape determining protein RodA